MKNSVSIKDNELLPKNIVGMLRLDYFDDAVGPVEGFQIFGDFMQHGKGTALVILDNPAPSINSREPADLRERIKNYDITEVLNTKLRKGRPKETRTSLICLDIFRSFGTTWDDDIGLLLLTAPLDQDGPWTLELVDKSLKHLRNPVWKVQKAGVITLSALAQTSMHWCHSERFFLTPCDFRARRGSHRP